MASTASAYVNMLIHALESRKGTQQRTCGKTYLSDTLKDEEDILQEKKHV
jgi:hypothetical protein